MNWFTENLGTLSRLLAHPVFVNQNTEITVWSILVLVSLFSLLALSVTFLGERVKEAVEKSSNLPHTTVSLITRVSQALIIFFGSTVILDASDVDISASQIFEFTSTLFKMPLIPVGEQPITLWMIAFVSILGYVLIYFTGKLQRWLAEKLNKRPSLDYGTAQSITSILRYALIAIGFVIILQAAGIDLSTVTVMAGALGIGVGLGLQNIVSNLVSGLVVMFERPVKVGDRIEVGGVLGDVVKLSLRAATIRTNDNIEIIVPNNEFINGNVTNWSHSSRDVRLNIPVGVSYSSDPEVVKKCLLSAAEECKMVLEFPEPDVVFDGFGDSALNFELRVYTATHVNKPRVLKSALNFLIFQKLKEADIEIPFPQRDLHLKSGLKEQQQIARDLLENTFSGAGKQNDRD